MEKKEEKVNRKLKAAIVLSGKTQMQIAEECFMSAASLSRRVYGKQEFSETEMRSVATAVGKPVSELFFEENENEKEEKEAQQ